MKRRFATLAAITDHVEAREPFHLAELRLGAETAAQQLGYRMETFRVRLRSRRYDVLERLLGEADAVGILLLPMIKSVDLTDYIDWSRYPIVAATHQVAAPEFHRVGPDHFANTLCTCQQLISQGHRSIGYIADEATDSLVARGLISAVEWINPTSYGDPTKLSVYPRESEHSVGTWLATERPGVVIIDTAAAAEKLMLTEPDSSARPIPFVTYEHAGSINWSGIDQNYRAIGTAAVNELHSRIRSRQKGIPEIATTMTVKGRWIEKISERAFGGVEGAEHAAPS